MSRYLEKAIIELRQNQTGPEAGRVFHEFAHFCDQQLQNPNSIEDYERALKLRHDKKAEVQELERILIAAKRDAQLCTKEEAKVKRGQVTTLARELSKAQSWLKLDDDEFNRLKDNHDAFLEKSVLNYLNCLEVCDDYDGDAVRFAALWMANSQEPKINQAASILSEVPSRKFVPLMNQISSRLLYTDDDFQRLLTDLITRICVDHPYHGLYQILALLRTSPKDNTSELRYKAVQHIAGSLKGQEKTKKTINALKLTTSAYDRLARAKVPPKEKGVAPNNKIAFFMSGYTDGNWTKRFDREIPSARVPPPTLHINVRADCDYSHLPRITRYGTNVDIASGLSAPKIIKCNATDGRTYKELVCLLQFLNG